MNENKAVFETMSVPKALATLAIPTIISQLITMIYNLADTYFIGKTNDPYKVAAASLAFVMPFMMSALSNLFGIGGGSLISRLLGLNRTDDAKSVCSFSFYGTIFIAFIYSLCCFLFMEPFLRLLGASDNTIGYATDYAFWIVVVGGIPSTLSMTMAHLLRSEGYAKKASFGLGMGGIINIALDPLFMFVLLSPGNEITGAAVATLISNVLTLVYFSYEFIRLRHKTVLSVSPARIVPGAKFLVQILATGFPSALGTSLACLANIVTNKLASGHGDIPLAALGIVKKIDMLPMNVGMGLCQGMIPLVAYNYSAKNYKRMRAVANCARISGIGFALICILVFELFARGICSLFIDEADTLELSIVFLRICCLATPLMISNFQMSYSFQAMGKGAQSLILSACRQGIVNIPLMFIMNSVFGLYGLVWTQMLSDFITLGISVALYRNVYKRLIPQKNS